MDYVNIPFPERIAFGAQSDPMWSTNVVASFGGRVMVNENWEDAQHNFDVSLAIRVVSDYMDARAHFHQVRGRAKAFPFKDFLDFTVDAADGITAEALTSSEGWQLYKQYGSGTFAYLRKITRPKLNTLAIYRTRAMVTTDVTANATIDYGGNTTDEPGGTFTVTGHVDGDAYTWAGEFWVPCQFGTDRLPAAATNKQPGELGELFVTCAAIPIVEVFE